MEKSATQRLFFALKPDKETVRGIRAVQSLVGAGEGRPVPAERLHATLLFLGNQSDKQRERLCQIASRLRFPACRVSLDRLGHFSKAAVAWLGPGKVPESLQQFQRELRSAMVAEGLEVDEREWRMHVTLYRDLRKRPERIAFGPVEWSLREFKLMESVSDKNGLHYLCRGNWSA